MAKRRRRMIIIGLTAAGLIMCLCWCSGGLGSRLHVKNFKKIRRGMSLAEVEKLLGGPPGNYGRYSENSGEISQEFYRAPPGSVERIWCDDNNRLEIYFDDEDRVVGFHKRGGYTQKPSGEFIERLWRPARRRLGL